MSSLGQTGAADLPGPATPSALGQDGAGTLVADTIARLRRAMRRAARAADPGNPLSVAQLELLSAVADEPGVRPGQLARRLRLARNSVTTLVNGLHTRGLIVRGSGGGDARAVMLTLTPAGQRAVDTWKSTNATIVNTALSSLGPHHTTVLFEALPALFELTQAIDELADSPPTGAE